MLNLEIYQAVDREELAKDIDAIQIELARQTDLTDFTHLKKIESWGRLCSVLGYATAWIAPNPISAYFISQGNFTRWTTVAHHVLHRGYDKIEGIPPHYTSKGFAKGWRRYLDWLDWMYPEAWAVEHNQLHHYHLGERQDPDQVEYNLAMIRNSSLPRWARYLVVAIMATTWKMVYYAPSTLYWLREIQAQKAQMPRDAFCGVDLWNPLKTAGRDLWFNCLLPYSLMRFVLLPMLFLPLGTIAATNVLLNSLLAEIFTNLHSFLIIAPNHTGQDVMMFDEKSKSKGEFYLRQIVGSVNYPTGTNARDFLHGWLNYQIEHHLWPDMTASEYQRAQPLVKAVCTKHHIPYIQESVFKRLKRTLDVMVGKTSMPRPVSIKT
jgi:fatty acid desaturase